MDFFLPLRTLQLSLFDLPISVPGRPGTPQVNTEQAEAQKKLAKRRYYFARRLKEKYGYEVDTVELFANIPYDSFEAMPVGEERYYVFQLVKLGFQCYFKPIGL